MGLRYYFYFGIIVGNLDTFTGSVSVVGGVDEPETVEIKENYYNLSEQGEFQVEGLIDNNHSFFQSRMLWTNSTKISIKNNSGTDVTAYLFSAENESIPILEMTLSNKEEKAKFNDVLIGIGYTLEEVDTAIRYVVPASQKAAIEWNKVTDKSFSNVLKKFNVTVTKSDKEAGTAQGDASLAGAKYGIYKGDQLVDTYVTDENGQFTTAYYVCGNDWSIKEIEPSEGYLLDSTSYHVGAEAENYKVEKNAAPAVGVTETVIKGNISIIKHTDNGETQIETPEEGAEFAIYLKSSGSYEAAKDTEKDYLVCDENGFAQSKNMPYGIYTVHQVKGWEGRELMKDFDVFISADGETYRYLINNANFESFIKVIKVDAETGNTIPYAGAAFQIFNPEGELVSMTFTYPEVTTIDTFYTDADGMLITPERLEYGKGYSLVEVTAPYGYVLNSDPVKFDVTQDDSTEESGITVVEVKKENTAQKGILGIRSNVRLRPQGVNRTLGKSDVTVYHMSAGVQHY